MEIQLALGVKVDGELGKESCPKLRQAMGQEPWHDLKPQKVLERLRKNRAAPGGPGRMGGN